MQHRRRMSANILHRGYARIPNDTTTASARNNCAGCKRYYSIRLFKSRWALLILLWYLLIYLSSIDSSLLFIRPPSPLLKDSQYSELLLSGVVAFTGALCPVFGYLADVHFGRYKVLVALSIILTIGQVSGGVLLILHALNYYTLHTIVATFMLLPSFIMSRAGLDSARFFIVIFGIEQLEDASSDELASYIFWCVWIERIGSTIVGLVNKYLGRYKNFFMANAVLSIVMALILWCFLWLNNRFASRRYNRAPLSSAGTYKLTLRVLKFAITHKYPLHRSALTYCEDEKIPRIDLGKSRYGGPFTTEQVEDVKTLLWILLIIVISCVASLPLQAQLDDVVLFQFSRQMRWSTRSEAGEVSHMMTTVVGVMIIFVHELVVFPLLRRWFPSILKRLGIYLLLCTATPLSYLLIQIMAGRYNDPNACMFQSAPNGTAFTYLNTTAALSEYAVLIPIISFEVAYTLFHCTLLELIIAQSPEHFKTMLVGLAMAFVGLRYLTFQVISQPFATAYAKLLPRQGHEDVSCDTIFYLLLVAIGLVGVLLYCAASRKYTYRKRDDVVINEHMYAEDYYSQGTRVMHVSN